MEVSDLRPPEPEPVFDPLAVGSGATLLVAPPLTTGERLQALCAHHGIGFACGAVVAAVVLRLL